jgi:hypothetical protein
MVLGTAGLAFAKWSRYGPPCLADDAGTEPKGNLEVAAKVVQTWDSGFYTTSIYAPVLTYGITDHLEFYVAPLTFAAAYGEDLHTGGDATLIRAYGNHGALNQDFVEVWLGPKYQIVEETKGGAMPAMALKYGLKIPCKTNSKYFTTGEVDHKLTYCVTKSLGKAQLDGNVAFRYYHRSDDPASAKYTNEWSWNTSLLYPIAPKTLLNAELTGKNEYRKVHMTSDDYVTDAYLGVKYSVTKDFKGKIAVGKRITCADPDILGYLGLVYYFHL